MSWDPQVEQRPHPFGEAGVRSSLEEVCKRAAEGASELLGNPKHLARVRTWSIERLHRAKQRGEPVDKPGDRARVLLKAVQDEKLWVPDPIGIEYIPKAHLMACDGDAHEDGTPCVKGDDCDGKVVFFAACCMSVGIYTMIVGHSYTRDNVIGHVLCKVYFDGKWHYADVSPLGNGKYMPLGKSAPFTRERYYSMPTIKVVCDAASCDVQNFDPQELGFVEQGTFVGLNGIPVVEMPPTVEWLGGARAPVVEWLGYSRGFLGEEKSVPQQVAEECVGVTSADVETKAGREQVVKSTAKCAAEAACAIYGKGAIPPGVCGSIAGPIVGAAVDVWNSVFGDDEAAERAKIRDANTAKFFQALDRLFVMDSAWSAYSQNTMTRLIQFHDQNLPSRRGAWGGGALVKRELTHADITKPGVPTEYQRWDVETYANPCPVFAKLTALGVPKKRPPDAEAALCDGFSPATLYYDFATWSQKNPSAGTVTKTNYIQGLVSKTLPQWFAALDKAANILRNEVVVEAVKIKIEGPPSSGTKSRGAVVVGALSAAAGLAWWAWSKGLLKGVVG